IGLYRHSRGDLQRPVVGPAFAGAEIGVPAEEARRGAIPHVAHVRFEREARGIQREGDGEIDGEGITGTRTYRGGRKRRGGRTLAGRHRADRKVHVAHETVAELACRTGGAGLQVFGLAVETVARIGDASAEWREDGEVRAGSGDDSGGIAVTPRDI